MSFENSHVAVHIFNPFDVICEQPLEVFHREELNLTLNLTFNLKNRHLRPTETLTT